MQLCSTKTLLTDRLGCLLRWLQVGVEGLFAAHAVLQHKTFANGLAGLFASLCTGGGAGAAEESAQRAQQDAAQGLQR
jgi:hypothetical protein